MPTVLAKNDLVIDGELALTGNLQRASSPRLAFGTNLLGQLQVEQSREFTLRLAGDEANRHHPIGDHDCGAGAASRGNSAA